VGKEYGWGKSLGGGVELYSTHLDGHPRSISARSLYKKWPLG